MALTSKDVNLLEKGDRISTKYDIVPDGTAITMALISNHRRGVPRSLLLSDLRSKKLGILGESIALMATQRFTPMQQPQQKTAQTKNGIWLTKLQSLPIEQRAFSFIFIMGVLGAVFGGITTDIELQGCMKSWDCFMSNPAQQRLDGIEKGAVAGIIAALVLSLPAIIKE